MADEGRVEKLAEERTKLARERTVLAHIRTGFASFLFGIALFGLFDTPLSRWAAYFFIAIGIAFLLTSGISYAWSKRRIAALLRRTRQKR